MVRLFYFILLFSLSLSAQNPTYQQKLYYTCKVWGYVKYYHSEVSTCQVNWDSILVADLPLVKNAVTQSDFNDALDTMLYAAGPMQIALNPLPDTIAPELKRNRDWSWINDTIFRSDVKTILDTIKNNFRPHPICWVKDNDYSTSYNGWLVFPYDDTILSTNTYFNFPDENKRLFSLFKYWNIINYFCPYNYVWDNSWDSTLFNYVLPFANSPNDTDFCVKFKMLTSELNDVHVNGGTGSAYISVLQDLFSPRLILKYLPGEYVVLKSAIPSIKLGDEIISVNGLTTAQWEDSIRPYVSYGDSSIFRQIVSLSMLCGAVGSPINISFLDSMNVLQSWSGYRSNFASDVWFTGYYPNDTLGNVKWKKWNCNVGYVNMGKLLTTDVYSMYIALQNTSAIIFDVRNYPNGTAWAIAWNMYPNHLPYSKAMLPDVTYPGTFFWDYSYQGFSNNPNSYSGKVIILMNEKTQSHAEYSCMIFQAMPNSLTVGSQTAGTDGNISYFNLSNDIRTTFTSLGIFYPNGDSTERIGIVPDSLVYPTQAGIRHHRDEVLEKALEIAQCWTSVPQQNSVQPVLSIYPNPSGNYIYLQSHNIEEEHALIFLTDVAGRVLYQKNLEIVNRELSAWLDLSDFASGIYFVQVRTGDKIFSAKVVKE